jgi:diaminopimelate epimerase
MKNAATRQVPFFKIHGAGNDFIVMERMRGTSTAAFVRKMAHRNLGIGADQLLEVLSRRPLTVQIWNRDGSKAEMCGNGARALVCLARQLKWLPPGDREVKLWISGREVTAIGHGARTAVDLGAAEVKERILIPVRKKRFPLGSCASVTPT